MCKHFDVANQWRPPWNKSKQHSRLKMCWIRFKASARDGGQTATVLSPEHVLIVVSAFAHNQFLLSNKVYFMLLLRTHEGHSHSVPLWLRTPGVHLFHNKAWYRSVFPSPSFPTSPSWIIQSTPAYIFLLLVSLPESHLWTCAFNSITLNMLHGNVLQLCIAPSMSGRL